MKIRPFAALLLVAFVPYCPAAELAGVVVPDAVVVAGKTLPLNGLGLRTKTIFNAKVYVGALYLPTRTRVAEEILAMPGPKRLDLTFLRTVAGVDIRNSWDEGFQANCDRRCEGLGSSIEKLKDLSRDVQKGQKVVFEFVDGTTTLKMGDEAPAEIAGKDFADLVLANFVGNAPTEALKDGLLGKLWEGPVSPVRELAGSRAP